MRGMCWQARGGNLAGIQMAASEKPSKWEEAGALADKRKSGAQELGSKTAWKASQNQGKLPSLSRWFNPSLPRPRQGGWSRPMNAVLRNARFESKNHSPREMPLVPSLKSHHVKIRKVCGFQIKEDPKCWAEEFALNSEAMTATKGFWYGQKNRRNLPQGFWSQPWIWMLPSPYAGNVIMSRCPYLHKSQFPYLCTFLLKWSWALCKVWVT